MRAERHTNSELARTLDHYVGGACLSVVKQDFRTRGFNGLCHSSRAIFPPKDATNYLSYYLHPIFLDTVGGPIIAVLECLDATRRVHCGE